MPYTFIKWIVWFLIAALVGGVIGYLLRGLRASAGQRRAVAAQPRGLAGDDLDRLRRKANEAAVATADRNAAIAERDALRAERDQLRAQLDECRAAATASASGGVHGFAAIPTLTDDDLAQGAAVLGRPVRRDDLTLVEGIGPKIAELLQAAGIDTWHALADHPVDGLREILAGGGTRYQVHDPGTWPAQADLVRHGRWEDFKVLTDRLDGGREPDA
jgi:predicted flap endonuclease-1-like 5' DNA nuclease